MLSRRLRIQFLEKMAQATPPNVPTEEVAETTSVSGSPPPFNALDYYPTMITGFQAKNMPWINGLSQLLNTVMFYSSNGKITLPWMRSNNFSFSGDQVPSADLKNLMNFTKLVYNQLYTNVGSVYKQQLTPAQIAEKIRLLSSSQFLNNLSSVQPGGQVATKIGGNVKTLIHNYLLQIK